MVIVITGPIASGKSTVARALAEELDRLDVRTAVIDLDVVKDMLTAGGSEPDADTWTLARRAAGTQANALLEDGVAVVIADGSYNLPSDRDEFEQQLEAGVSPLYVTLTVTFQEALRRAQSDPTRGSSRDPVFLEGYFATAERASANRPATDIVFDTESVGATDAAAAIARLVQGRR